MQYAEIKNTEYQPLEEKTIEGLYQKMTDPYVHFSEYRLGIKDPKKAQRSDRFHYDLTGSDSDEEKDKIKFQRDKTQ